MSTKIHVLQNQPSLIDHVFGPNTHCFVRQRVEAFEMLTGFETENKYDVEFENGFKAVAMEGMLVYDDHSSEDLKSPVVLRDTSVVHLDRSRCMFLLRQVSIFIDYHVHTLKNKNY